MTAESFESPKRQFAFGHNGWAVLARYMGQSGMRPPVMPQSPARRTDIDDGRSMYGYSAVASLIPVDKSARADMLLKQAQRRSSLGNDQPTATAQLIDQVNQVERDLLDGELGSYFVEPLWLGHMPQNPPDTL